jgi:hypothetical protein
MAHELTDMAQAASVLSKARRISVIGCPGGKTTLARWLSAELDGPVHDQLRLIDLGRDHCSLFRSRSRNPAGKSEKLRVHRDERQTECLKVFAVCRPHPALTYLE